MSTPSSETQIVAEPEAEPQLRDLFSFTAGNRTFGVFAEYVEGTADSRRPAPLPFAPAAVLGMVSVRGRMLTTLDPLALLGGEPRPRAAEVPCVIALRGDEQLALAADSLGETITIAATDIEPAPPIGGQSDNAVEGISRHAGQEITILNIENLFAAAVQRRERRRRRF